MTIGIGNKDQVIHYNNICWMMEPDQSIREQREKNAEISIRKNREDRLEKKRMVMYQDDGSMGVESTLAVKVIIVDEQRTALIKMLNQQIFTEDMLPELHKALSSTDLDQVHRGLIGIRKILGNNTSRPPIKDIIHLGTVTNLLQFISQRQFPQLELEAAWVLTNMAAGTTEECTYLVSKGLVNFMGKLLSRDHNDPILFQAVWCLGNIAGDSPENRNKVLQPKPDPEQRLLPLFINVLNNSKDKRVIQKTTWVLSNLCRGRPLPKYDVIKDATKPLCDAVKSQILQGDELSDCLWALSHLSQGAKSRIQRVLQTGVQATLPKLVVGHNLSQTLAALRIIGNISTGNELQTEQLLQNGVIQLLHEVLYHEKKAVRREACWIISNITGGTAKQVKAVTNQRDMVRKILELFGSDQTDIKREICYVFSNMANRGDPHELLQFYRQAEVLKYYAELFSEKMDLRLVEINLECLFHLLKLGEKFKGLNQNRNPLVQDLTALPGVKESIQDLQYSHSVGVYRKTVRLMQEYFPLESEMEEQRTSN